MTTAQEMVDLLSEALTKNVGVASITFDGHTLTLNRDQLIRELAYWENKAGKQNGSRPLYKPFDLSGAF